MVWFAYLLSGFALVMPQPVTARSVAPFAPCMLAQEATSPVEVWVSKPNAIVLTPKQHAQVDSAKAQYSRERKAILSQPVPGDEIAIVKSMSELHGKYRKLVRSFLNPAQQALFDKNMRHGAVPMPRNP